MNFAKQVECRGEYKKKAVKILKKGHCHLVEKYFFLFC
jgi:hypothetical protein